MFLSDEGPHAPNVGLVAFRSLSVVYQPFIFQHFSSTCQQPNIVALHFKNRCCTYYHPLQTLSRSKILLLQVEEIC